MYKYIVATVLLLLPGIMNANDADSNKSREIAKSFPISSITYVEVENKYGDIEVELWEKDSIRFEIEITAHSDKEEDLDEMLDLIKIDMKANDSYVLVATNWIEEINAFKKGMMKFNQKVSSKKRYEVSYKISMPDGIDLSIKNTFGNIFLPSYTGKLEIDIAYGDLRAHKLENVKELTSKSGKVKIKELTYGRVNISSSKSFHIEKCIEMDMESSSSEITIDQIKTLSLISSHDDIIIENINVLSGSFSMSDVTIDQLNSKVNTTSKYGSLKIKYADPACESIVVNATKTDVSLYYTLGFNANVEIALNDKKDFTYNSSYNVESSGYDSNSIFRSNGKIHNGGGTIVNIESINGYVELESK